MTELELRVAAMQAAATLLNGSAGATADVIRSLAEIMLAWLKEGQEEQ